MSRYTTPPQTPPRSPATSAVVHDFNQNTPPATNADTRVSLRSPIAGPSQTPPSPGTPTGATLSGYSTKAQRENPVNRPRSWWHKTASPPPAPDRRNLKAQEPKLANLANLSELKLAESFSSAEGELWESSLLKNSGTNTPPSPSSPQYPPAASLNEETKKTTASSSSSPPLAGEEQNKVVQRLFLNEKTPIKHASNLNNLTQLAEVKIDPEESHKVAHEASLPSSPSTTTSSSTPTSPRTPNNPPAITEKKTPEDRQPQAGSLNGSYTEIEREFADIPNNPEKFHKKFQDKFTKNAELFITNMENNYNYLQKWLATHRQEIANFDVLSFTIQKTKDSEGKTTYTRIQDKVITATEMNEAQRTKLIELVKTIFAELGRSISKGEFSCAHLPDLKPNNTGLKNGTFYLFDFREELITEDDLESELNTLFTAWDFSEAERQEALENFPEDLLPHYRSQKKKQQN